MIDFTKKGTKLPIIPIGTEFMTVCFQEFDKRKIKFIQNQITSMVSYGIYSKDYILCKSADYENHGGTNYFIIKLSTIERLAKEQGMWDEIASENKTSITTFKYVKDGNKIDFSLKIEPKPTHNYKIGGIQFENKKVILDQNTHFLDAIKYNLSHWSNCLKTNTINNMNPTIKLQENGTVTVTDTETTTTLSKVTVDEICRLVKEDIEKVKLEVGKWYHYIGGLYVWNNGNTTYGFNSQKRFDDHYSFSTSNDAVEATPETVQQYLIEEAVKRGFLKDGVSYVKEGEKQAWTKTGNLELEYNRSTNELKLWSDKSETKEDGYIDNHRAHGTIFRKGVWTTILKPETITRAEAEKRLGKVITD